MLRKRCLYCDKKLGFWGWVWNRRFCSAEHEQKLLEELRVIAIKRLQKDLEERRVAVTAPRD